MKRVALIHTAFALVEVLAKSFSDIIPEAELIHIVDDSLLKEVLAKGKVTKPVVRRLISYYKAAEQYKVDCILNSCSSVGEVVDIARQIINTPIIRIDEKMAEMAVSRSDNIGVAATLKTTLDPTCRLLERKAALLNKKIRIKKTVCKGAYEELVSGNPKKHDEIVEKKVRELVGDVEILVFAQGSMARFKGNLEKNIADRVFTNIESGAMAVRGALGL